MSRTEMRNGRLHLILEDGDEVSQTVRKRVCPDRRLR